MSEDYAYAMIQAKIARARAEEALLKRDWDEAQRYLASAMQELTVAISVVDHMKNDPINSVYK